MKKYFVLLFLILSTQLFSQINPEITSIKTLHILEGIIDNKYPITMYLTIEEGTKKVDGKYYYNNIGDFVYLKESVSDNNSKVILKEFSSNYYNDNNSTGEFVGTINKKMVFKGTWSNGKKSFNFEVKPNKKNKIQEIEIVKYTFEDTDYNSENPPFGVSYEILKIANSKKIATIENVNKELEKTSGKAYDYNDDYSVWKKNIDVDGESNGWGVHSSYELIYIDNNVISIISKLWAFPATNRPIMDDTPLVYSLNSGKILNERIDDLIYSVDDEKFIILMKQKIETQYGDFSSFEEFESYDFFKSQYIYNVNASGITFQNQNFRYPLHISFTYDELKPFVNKKSELYYLFK